MGNCVTGDQSARRNVQASGSSNPSTTIKKVPKLPHNKNQHQLNDLKPILKPSLPNHLITPTSNPHLKDKIKVIPSQNLGVKVPKDMKNWTEFQWTMEPKYQIPAEIYKEPSSFIRTRSFQQKYKWLRQNLEQFRIHFTQGKSQILEVDKENLLMSSNSQFENINFHKEVKINFKDEKDTSDAGGLLREWMNLCINQIFSPQLNILSLCDSSTTSYKFNFNELVKQLFQVAAKILGIVIGKAIFQRIPLKCFLNYTILRQICSQNIQINDIFSYDADLYRGWSYMIDNNMITCLEQNFCVYEFDEHGTQITVPLKENGFYCKVTSENKDEYIELLIKHYCTTSIIKMIQNLRYGIYKIIPHDLLSVFEPHQLDMIINGKKDIDLEDLKNNTMYSNCRSDDQLISWFWEYVNGLTQDQLQNVLHFVTGNSRVPILGFKYLESNRGEYQLFEIRKVEYDSMNPYPKSHTCFNRLQLPHYPDKESFDRNIVYISVENHYFGLQ